MDAVLGERFELDAKLDEDDSGEIHRATDRREGRGVLVKILRGLEGARRERVLREAKRAAGLKHEGLAAIVEVGQTERGEIFVAWEEIEGERLSERLARPEPLAEEDAAFLASQMCRALAAAHDASVMHRELRPSVILLRGEGDALRATIAELGVPAAAASGSEARFVAPEHRRGEPAGRRADVYSLGMILDAMLAGRAEGAFATVVKRCLAEDPRDRFLDTVAVDAALRMASSPVPSGAGASSRPPRISSLPPAVSTRTAKESSRPPPVAPSSAPPSSKPASSASASSKPEPPKADVVAARAPAAPPPRPLTRPLAARPRWEDLLLDIGDGPWPRVVVTTVAAFVIARIFTSGALPFLVAIAAAVVAWFTWVRSRPRRS
ncbi:MAG: protein kinase [Labilithrix sp.]|nr:protein kinase [Labilithrix sp.]